MISYSKLRKKPIVVNCLTASVADENLGLYVTQTDMFTDRVFNKVLLMLGLVTSADFLPHFLPFGIMETLVLNKLAYTTKDFMRKCFFNFLNIA